MRKHLRDTIRKPQDMENWEGTEPSEELEAEENGDESEAETEIKEDETTKQ